MEMSDLPEPSAMLIKLIPMLSYPEVRLDQIVQELERDQALVARMLKLVNSSYYHLKFKVDTVRAAVGLLGLSTIKQIVFSAICYSYFTEEERRSWNHAFTTSVLMNSLVKGIPGQESGCLQLTALLHDIGKIVLRRKYGRRYKYVLEQCSGSGLPPHEAERLEFGCDHGVIGSWLLESWQMRQDLVIPIANHHQASLPESFPKETALLAIADWIDNEVRSQPRPAPCQEAFEIAGLGKDGIDRLTAIHAERIASLEQDINGVVAS